MNFLKTKLVSQTILFIARLVDRKPQPGCHVVHTNDTVLLVTPDGFSIALSKPAAQDLAGKLNPMGLTTQTLREAA